MNIIVPPFKKSTCIKDVIADPIRYHYSSGDMWPLTWADDGNLYGSAGDNNGLDGKWSPMNFWKISGYPQDDTFSMEIINNLPIDPAVYCQKPNVDSLNGIKPASLIHIDGVLYFAVENINYGDNPEFNRQHNINSWIITSTDYGVTWNRQATAENFFTGRLSSPHFIQYGKSYKGAKDKYLFAYFTAADDGNSYWCNSDYMLLGRVSTSEILIREAWEFYTGLDSAGCSIWDRDDNKAIPVFSYKLMTGENHVSYNSGIKRYILGNYGFYDENGKPRPYHQIPIRQYRTQLSLYEAPEPWGPWSLFYRDDNWGIGDYQPCFPTKWMSDDGKTMYIVSSGNEGNYNFMTQKIMLDMGD